MGVRLSPNNLKDESWRDDYPMTYLTTFSDDRQKAMREMTQISDERLRELVEKCNSSDWQAPKERCSYGLYINELEQMATELLSARETIERLVENSKELADGLDTYWQTTPEGAAVLKTHTALLAELEGKG